MTVPIHPMGWLTYGLVVSAFGLWVAADSDPLIEPQWLSGAALTLLIYVMLGMAVALIAKTEKR
ncbi:hypothetical protein [Brevundimonas sp.]|uniref:hypothetical protein n=1 Tax=Brevundimonas sp. TaxID=1871086 RepID=UPI003F71C2DE